jgi:hypothetical protein
VPIIRGVHSGRRRGAASVGAALAVIGALLPWTSAATASTAPGPLVRVGSLAGAPAPAGSVDEGSAPATTTSSIEIVLAPSDPAGLDALVAAQYDPGSPQYHHWLTPASFEARFGPSGDTVAEATTWLRQRGLHPARTSTFALTAPGSTAVLDRAMGTVSHRVRTRAGASGIVAHGAPLVPADLVGRVVAIHGLNTLPAFDPSYQPAAGVRPAAVVSPAAAVRPAASSVQACSAASSAANTSGADTLDQLTPAYGIDALQAGGLTGGHQTVGVYELAPYSTSDVATYKSCFQLSNPVTRVTPDGPASPDSGGTAEADLDIEQVATQAPGAAIISYEANNDTTSAFDLWEAIVHDDSAQAVSTSWTLCETDANTLGELPGGLTTVFKEAAAQGQTILAASGDSGSEGCAQDFPSGPWNNLNVDYPASDANVTAVGGTYFNGPGEQPVWNDCMTATNAQRCASGGGFQAAGGGGESMYVARPSWQPAVFDPNPPVNQPCGTACRELPDISANAGVSMISYAAGFGGWWAGVGTSFAAPLLAGLVADRNQGCTASTGNFAPKLYALAATSAGNAAGFQDSTSGNNDMLGDNGGDFAAGPGYDLATGLGTPIASGLACPDVESVTPNTGSAGDQVTVTGLGLENAQISFGGTLVTPTAATATSATVILPPATGQVTVSATAAGETGSQTAVFTYPGETTTTSSSTTSTTSSTTTTTTTTVPPTTTTTSSTTTTTVPKPVCATAGGRLLSGAAGIAATDIAGCDGYFVVDSAGQVAAFGSAASHGDLSGHPLAAPIIAIEATPDGKGYWMLGADGGVFTFGDAHFYGSTGGVKLAAPVVGMAVTPDNKGYWIVARDGGVFSFGDARFYGSTGGVKLTAPVDGIAVAPGGHGYWLVAGDGGVFTFTSDGFYGSLGGVHLDRPIVGMSSTPDGRGYTLVGSDGGVFTFGDAPFLGSLGAHPPATPIVDLSPAPANNGYYLVSAGGVVYAFGPGSRYFGGV